MALILTPRDYKNMKWDVAPSNIIDTINGSAIINRADTEERVVYDTTTIKGKIGNTEVTFPIDKGNTTFLTHYSWNRRRHTSFWDSKWYHDKGRSEQVRASGSFLITVDVPVEGANTIKIIPEGKSYEWTSSSKPSWSIIPDDLAVLSRSTPFDDIFNQTAGYHSQRDLSTDFNRLGNSITAQQSNNPVTFVDQAVGSSSIDSGAYPNADAKVYFKSATMKPLGDNLYEVTWHSPIKHLVMSITRDADFWGNAGSVYDYKIFLDVVTVINFEVSGRPFNTDSISFSYSLTDGVLTTSAKNNYPEKLDSNELITLNSTMNGQPWQEQMAYTLLKKYENGKYIVIVDIKGEWMLRNNVHINKLVEIYSLRGVKISRNEQPVTFEVKAIEKNFNANTFYYRTMFLEV